MASWTRFRESRLVALSVSQPCVVARVHYEIDLTKGFHQPLQYSAWRRGETKDGVLFNKPARPGCMRGFLGGVDHGELQQSSL